jgi:AMP phosphorylase
MSKKKAMGSSHVVIDIPTGRGTKIKTIGQAQVLARDFIDLGERLDMYIECAVTEGEQPIGHAVGPILEAREALQVLMGKKISDLIDKATTLAGILFEMAGERKGKKKAQSLLSSGKAEKTMRQIIEAQGGDPETKPEDLIIGRARMDIKTEVEGRILWINNRAIVRSLELKGHRTIREQD